MTFSFTSEVIRKGTLQTHMAVKAPNFTQKKFYSNDFIDRCFTKTFLAAMSNILSCHLLKNVLSTLSG